MIAVIGGTGTVGAEVVRELDTLGVPTRTLVRKPLTYSTHCVVGDARNESDLRAFLANADRVFFAMANGPEQLNLELDIVRIAAAAGVRHIVKLSSPIVGPPVPVAIARVHLAVEEAIGETGMEATLLRPYAFMQNLLRAQATTINQSGMFFGMTDNARMNMVDVRDIAKVAVAALVEPTCPRGPLVLTGERTVSYPEIADLLSITGKRITYVNQRPSTMRHGMERAGLEPWLIDHIIEIQTQTLMHPELPTDTVQVVTGHSPRRIEDFLVENGHRFQPPRWSKPAPFHWLATRALSRSGAVL